MTRKLAFTALIVVTIAQVPVNDFPLTQDWSVSQSHLPRHLIDRKTPLPATRSRSELPSITSKEIVGASRNPAQYDTDIPVLASTLDLAGIDTLIASGALALDLPDGTQTTLTLTRVKRQFGTDHLLAESDGYAATITRRGKQFFAAVATQNGSFRIESTSRGGSQIFPHQLIAQRRIQHEADYRHAHSNNL
jgi:hypothetical protein